MKFLHITPLATILLSAASTQNANAAILDYLYQGQELVCTTSAASCLANDGRTGEAAWTGKVIIDESLLPGSTLSNLTISFSWFRDSTIGDIQAASLRISDQTGLLASDQQSGGQPFDWSAYGILWARYQDLISPTIAFASFALIFDADKAIITWGGNNHNGCGCNDPVTGNGFDQRGLSRSIGPGTWSGPAPHVPLPPALLLFASALGLGSLLGWHRNVRAQTTAA